jgi:hypothetical protein
VPRTEYRKKRAIRFCGACGYELALDSDGPCPMCPRLDQLRLNSVVPRPSELHRASARETQRSAAPAEWRPTVAEYRAMLAARRVAFTDESRGRVIRTPALRQARIPHPPRPAHAADDEALTPPEQAQALGEEPSPTSPRKANGRTGKLGARGATNHWEAPPKRREAHGVVAVAAKSVPAPSQPARPAGEAAPARRVESRSRGGATRAWPVSVALVVMIVLIGLVVGLVVSILPSAF